MALMLTLNILFLNKYLMHIVEQLMNAIIFMAIMLTLNIYF
jgi:hypothetical protein